MKLALTCACGPRRKRSLLPIGKPTLGGFLMHVWGQEPCSSLQFQFVAMPWDATHGMAFGSQKNPPESVHGTFKRVMSGVTLLIPFVASVKRTKENVLYLAGNATVNFKNIPRRKTN